MTIDNSFEMIEPEVKHDLLVTWKDIQEEMKNQVITYNTETWQNDEELHYILILVRNLKPISSTYSVLEFYRDLKLVGGMDISYPVFKHDDETNDNKEVNTTDNDDESSHNNIISKTTAIACVVICSYPSMEILHQETEKVNVEEPYIPGFLAFRECKPLTNLLDKILKEKPELKPDVLLVDGNGILHPQKCGVACHIGIQTSIPTIGVAKNIYQMENLTCDKKSLRDGLTNVGDFVEIKLKDDDDNVLGVALKTAEKIKNPVYVSIGHKISLKTAIKVVLGSSKYRISEPLRFADHNSREFIRQHLDVRNSS